MVKIVNNVEIESQKLYKYFDRCQIPLCYNVESLILIHHISLSSFLYHLENI